MSRRSRNRWLETLLVLTLMTPSLSLGAEPSESTESAQKPDFLFRTPRGSLGVRGGWGWARANSDIYDFVQEQLTVEKGDFHAPLFVVDVTMSITANVAGMFRFEYGRAEAGSEFREYVDQDDNPITQTTELTKIPLTATLKYYLKPRGREISRYAWVPYSFAPYVGGGGGVLWYRFRQAGDFVDSEDLSIFSDLFESEGWTATVHVVGGVDIKLTPRLFLTVEACYAWADAELSPDFVGFDPIDLSGFKTTVGIDLVF